MAYCTQKQKTADALASLASSSSPPNQFSPINPSAPKRIAGGRPQKRRQTDSKDTNFRVESNNEDMEEDNKTKEEDEPVEETQAQVKKRYQATVLGGVKNTQIQSAQRAEVNHAMPRSETCLRYAGEFAKFPDLICTLAPNSTARKCVDCVKKAKSCDKVPARLLPALQALQDVAANFTIKAYTKKELTIAQATFNTKKKRVNHNIKTDNTAAAKSPWKPMVDSNIELAASLTSAIQQANGILVMTLHKKVVSLLASNNLLIEEIQGLRSDFRIVHQDAFPPATPIPEVNNNAEVPEGSNASKGINRKAIE